MVDGMVDGAMRATRNSPRGAGIPKLVPEGVAGGSSTDPNVVDLMYDVAELMSRPPTGGVTFQAFSTLPPISVLSGGRGGDVFRRELTGCWPDGSPGAARVDRAGFERVWREVQGHFGEDIMEEARLTSHPKVKKTRRSEAEAEVVRLGSTQVGTSLTEDQMKVVNGQVKNMSDGDMAIMLEGFDNLSRRELAECWSGGSPGAARVDRAGFERVWREAQGRFREDIKEEARMASHRKVKKTRRSEAEDEVAGSGLARMGASLTADQMKVVNDRVKNMSDDDVTKMLEGFDIGPEEEAGMRAMGVDPAMVKKAAEIMRTDPTRRKAAHTMMKNMSPDQMLKASRQSQSQMAYEQGGNWKDVE